MLSERTERYLAELLSGYELDYDNASLGKGRFPGQPGLVWAAMLREAYQRGRQDEREGWPEPSLPAFDLPPSAQE